MKKLGLLIVIYPTMLICDNKPHEIWWQEKLADPKMMTTFQGWLGDINAPSRLAARSYIMSKQYKSILDLGCGLCTELDGYIKSNYPIEYFGVDITERLVEAAKKREINCVLGSAENIPMVNCSVDVVYARHLLEHLSYYENAIVEMVRCAKKEVVVVFFMKPHEQPDHINYALYNGCYLYHNCYDKKKMDHFIGKLFRVKSVNWQDVNNAAETILHIVLEQGNT